MKATILRTVQRKRFVSLASGAIYAMSIASFAILAFHSTASAASLSLVSLS